MGSTPTNSSNFISLLSIFQSGKPIPLVLDHINGNPYDNLLSNLRVICPNCNTQTSAFAGRNKRNGRFERAKRYKLEKEIMNDIKADVVQ